MIETKVYQNENCIHRLDIYINGILAREFYYEQDDEPMSLYEIAGIAEEMYEAGFEDGGKDH